MINTKATELKAEPMTEGQLDRWLSGAISRRILVIPFGGPIPSAKSQLGVDLDDEWFDAATDLYGQYPALRRTRERLVDWHHDDDPTGVMKGAVLGRVVLDTDPSTATVDDIDYTGVWADFWANAGERRKALIKRLAERATIYGSSQPVSGGVRKAATGHIDIWPVYRHTLSTSPQNTYAVMPALKAVLDGDTSALTVAALSAALVGLEEMYSFPAGGPGFPDQGGKGIESTTQLERIVGELELAYGLKGTT